MKSVRLPHYLYTASLFFLILLTAICIGISAADVIIQALTDKTSTGKFDFRNLVVVSGSYVLLVMSNSNVLMIIMLISEMFHRHLQHYSFHAVEC